MSWILLDGKRIVACFDSWDSANAQRSGAWEDYRIEGPVLGLPGIDSSYGETLN